MVSNKELFYFFWSVCKEQKYLFLTILLLNAFIWPLEITLWPYLIHIIVDIFTLYDSNRTAAWELLKSPVLAVICFTVFFETLSIIMGHLYAKVIPKLQKTIRVKMFDHIQRHTPHYFNERVSGSLGDKISDLTTQAETIANQLFFPIIPAVTGTFFCSAFLFFIHPLFALILFIWIIIHILICIYFAHYSSLYQHVHGQARSHLLGKIVDSLSNNFAVNLFYRFPFELEYLQPSLQEEVKTNTKTRVFVEQMRLVTSIFFICCVVLIIFGTNIYFWLQGYISTGEAVQISGTTWNIAGVMWMVSSSLPLVFHSTGLAKQAYLLLKEPQDLGDISDAKALQVSKGEIVFDKVSFNYSSNKLFIKKSVHIKGGEKIGLVGFSGAGKSTFINLILRFYPLAEGKILIDGQDISQVSLESLRKQVALIPQHPILFHRTLKENIAYGNPSATDKEIIKAAKLAHCDEFIQRIPQKYEAKVGELGSKLSGGERQRVAIARAILANAPILLLDEATSALDSVTEKYIQESLNQLMQGRTTLVIAHRLSTLSQMDRILVFDKGKIAEEGSHETLLSKGGLYSKMWKMQIGGFIPDAPAHLG